MNIDCSPPLLVTKMFLDPLLIMFSTRAPQYCMIQMILRTLKPPCFSIFPCSSVSSLISPTVVLIFKSLIAGRSITLSLTAGGTPQRLCFDNVRYYFIPRENRFL